MSDRKIGQGYVDRETLREVRQRKYEAQRKKQKRRDMITIPFQVLIVALVLAVVVAMPVAIIALIWGWIDWRWFLTEVVVFVVTLLILTVASS